MPVVNTGSTSVYFNNICLTIPAFVFVVLIIRVFQTKNQVRRWQSQRLLVLLLRRFTPQGGNVTAQFPYYFRKTGQFVFHAHQQKPAQYHGEAKVFDKAEHFANFHLPSPSHRPAVIPPRRW